MGYFFKFMIMFIKFNPTIGNMQFQSGYNNGIYKGGVFLARSNMPITIFAMSTFI